MKSCGWNLPLLVFLIVPLSPGRFSDARFVFSAAADIVFVLFTALRAVFRSFTAVSSDRSLAGIVQPYCPQKKV